MKKILFGLTFLGSLMMTSITVQAQVEEEPCPEGTVTNSYGGVCCEASSYCYHPIGTAYSQTTWTSCVATCS